MARSFFVYIMTNRYNRVLYTGVTNDLVRRVWQHRQGASWFTEKYQVTKLVYYEVYADPLTAISREKQLKAGSRARKLGLVRGLNPQWRDLWPEIASALRASQ